MRPVSALFLSVVVSSLAGQRKTLAGRVTDAHTGRAVSSGTVKVVGAPMRDVLRPDGVFVLDVDVRDVTLLVEGEGYQTREIFVPAARETVLIELRNLAYTLEAATVVGDAAEGETGVIDGRDLERVPASVITESLTGRVSGVDVQHNSGAPGDISLQLRGISTLLGTSQPLFVVDGVVVNTSGVPAGTSLVTDGQEVTSTRIADLNPRDIATIRILRGAAATVRYGSRGANGVVVIRTKRGR